MNCDVDVTSAVSDYAEYSPPLPLARHLVCLWTQKIRGSRDEFAQRVLPDGCVDIVLINDVTPMVIGPWTEPFVARLAAGTMIVGARCRPGHAPSLLGLPVSALLNQSVPLSAVCGSVASSAFERIAKERTIAARKSAMEFALISRLSHGDPVDEARAQPSAGFLTIRTAEFSNSVNGSESAAGNSSGGSPRRSGTARRCFSPCCVSSDC